jgi:predicted RNase H-like nuclease
MKTRIIGVDCAVNEKNVGIAAGDLHSDKLVVFSAIECGRRAARDIAAEFLIGVDQALIALDAPLGWPASLGTALASHRAGEPIVSKGHELFRRTTDEVVKRETGQQPLDVGADRIARTAVAALRLVDQVRTIVGAEIPLAWTPSGEGIRAIEVYPAATLRQLGITPRAYKGAGHVMNRMSMLEALSRHADLREVRRPCEANGDAFDAVVCVIAGNDFLRDRCVAPANNQLSMARQEGWIWFRAKK